MKKKDKIVNNGIRLIITLTICVTAFLLINAVNTYQHEQVHYKINEYIGIESKISYSLLMLGGKVTPTDNQTISQDKEDYYFSMHTLNEIIGYNVQSVLYALMIITGLLIWRELK